MNYTLACTECTPWAVTSHLPFWLWKGLQLPRWW